MYLEDGALLFGFVHVEGTVGFYGDDTPKVNIWRSNAFDEVRTRQGLVQGIDCQN